MCDCSKSVTKTECEKLKKYAFDPERRFFIYHIFNDERGLKIAFVPKEKNPNQLAIERGFTDEEGSPKWFNVREHPCIYE